MNETNITRETLVDKGLQYNWRSYTGWHYYFISKPGKQCINGRLPLQSNEKNIVLFNPVTTTSFRAKAQVNNAKVETWIQQDLEKVVYCKLPLNL